MQVYTSSVDDELVDGLSFKLSPGSSYITSRNSVSYFPTGSNIYTTAAGTKVLRILLSGDDWVDPATLRIFFDVRNNGPGVLFPLGGPYSFWRRMRVLVGNTLVEDTDYYNRTHHMMDILRAKHVRENEDAEGFESRYDQPLFWDWLTSMNTTGTDIVYPSGQLNTFFDKYVGIDNGSFKTVSFRPLSGLLNCGKLIPLRYAPITIELELCNSAYDPIVATLNAGDTSSFITNTAKVISTSWQIENPQIKVDVVTIDNALQNEYAALLLSGKTLPINFSTYITQLQSISGPTPSVNITRALSRLKSVFVTFNRALTADQITGHDTHLALYKKEWNDLYHPMSYSYYYDPNFELEAQLQIGSMLFPNYPIRSLQESFYQLRKCMGTETSNFHSFDISNQKYRSHSYILAIDTEKHLGASFTGLDMKTGSLMSLKMKGGTGAQQGNKMPDTCYIVLHADCILSIRDSGVEIFD